MPLRRCLEFQVTLFQLTLDVGLDWRDTSVDVDDRLELLQTPGVPLHRLTLPPSVVTAGKIGTKIIHQNLPKRRKSC